MSTPSTQRLPGTLGAVEADLDQSIARYVASRNAQRGDQGSPERDVHRMLEKRVLREAHEPEGGGLPPDDIDWKTPVGDLLLLLACGRQLTRDVEWAPDAWGQFADQALETFATDLDMVCEFEQAQYQGEGSWPAVYRIMVRMRAAAQAFRRLQEARHGMSPHWGGAAPKADEESTESTTAPSDEARATEQLSKAGLGVSFPRDPATLDAIRAHEERIIEAVTPAVREACQDLGSAMAFVTSNAEVFTDREVRGALLDLLQQINANVWSVKGELGIDVFRAAKATPTDTEVTP